MKKLIIIPAYNESSNIEGTIQAIKEKAPHFDYVIINDCSTDNTLEICKKNKYNVVDLPINLGIGGAVQTGYLYAKKYNYDIAVQIDGDGQHDPAFLEEMANILEKNQVDMVIGSRFIKNEGFQSSFARRMGIRYFTWIIKLMTGNTITDATSGLRLVNRSLIEKFAVNYPQDYPEPETVVDVLHNHYTIKEIPVIMKERQGGVSSISLKKSIYYMFKVSLAIVMVKLRGRENA
ncbi:glycosyltransferase family 2 protein [Streptococcus himalayensis]|uniref:Glycosyl transferase n=1 Tax=Streptococcus himalayensis TaxID=1888195 RepID=A0A917A5N6_9STRE|nr:glycosyltransferase family 2 protein [Streptococcus himalayensis]GGE27861.1 putative glycosyl transferase [Streptococcus himalayensis]